MTENQTRMKEIEELLTKYKAGITQEQSAELMEKIRGARFIVPVTFPKDETLAAMQEELARTGQPVRIPKDAKPIPILIQNPNKEQFLAVYTSFAQLPKEGNANGVIEMTFEVCMNYVKSSKVPVVGVVINPFSNNFIIRPRKDQQVTPAQFHVLARKNIEYVLLPHSIYTKGKEYFDGIDSEVLLQFFKDQYQGKLPLPYTKDDFEVMQLGISPKLDLIHMSMPTKKLEQGGCIRVYATWHKEAEHAGYYMIVRGEDKSQRHFFYMDESGKTTDLGEAPVESVEMQRVMDLELERYEN
ncbi:MAG: SseB family protein [bacterium]|nr:SseB family protein [bacterium]MDY4100106.1 SseB family protein [Lachnospiraceae bacterium]